MTSAKKRSNKRQIGRKKIIFYYAKDDKKKTKKKKEKKKLSKHARSEPRVKFAHKVLSQFLIAQDLFNL